MRKQLIGIFSLVVAVTACSNAPSESFDAANSSSDDGIADNASTHIVSVSGSPGNCEFTWDGKDTSDFSLLVRAVASFEDAIAEKGGIENMTFEDMPIAIVESAGDQDFQCPGLAIRDLKRSGYADLRLKMINDTVLQPATLLVPMEYNLVSIAYSETDSSGRFFWSGEQAEIAGLGPKLDAFAKTTSSPREFVLRVNHETKFSRIYEIAEAFAKRGMPVSLTSCSEDDVNQYLTQKWDNEQSLVC